MANSRFCRVFYDAGFEWLQKLIPSISMYATRALSGRLLFHARLRRVTNFCTRSVLLLKVNVCNFANFGTQNTYGKFSESHRIIEKILYFLSFLMYGRPAGHRIRPWQTVEFAAFFYDAGFFVRGYRS